MKELQPDDPRVTAYALDELSTEEASLLASQGPSDDFLRSERVKTQALGKLLSEAFEREGQVAVPAPARIETFPAETGSAPVTILRSARGQEAWLRGVGLSFAVAASIALVLVLLARTPVGQTLQARLEPEELQMEVVLTPAALASWGSSQAQPAVPPASREPAADPAEPEPLISEAQREFAQQILNDPQRFFASAERTARRQYLPPADSFAPLHENGYLSTRESPSTTVPVMAGRTSFAWVERFLRERGQLPPRDAVRLEELVNYPDYREKAGAQVGGVALTSELVPSPWDEDVLLLGLLLQRQPGSAESEKVSVELHVDEERVAEYRLLGFARPDGDVVPGADASHPLAAGNSTYVFYEIRPGSQPFDEVPLGKVSLAVSSDSASTQHRDLTVPAIPTRWVESSNSFRTAATVAAYALVLRDSPYKGSLDLARVESLARQTLLEIPEPDEATREVLQLIIETRLLAGLKPTA
ncbi:VWA domain-containing protein [Roseibacillus ishigakijimensis]|uniref:von Willebrand factor type A domain-containing protein n=1 Tax=Roseibacillus ishigakijimensis TaxID=454146 RepID=A0A934VMB4_9BACT|nr:von Willebrand factor type A domain-containing protein [Roseibacillus ishigakijimensis]MBK1835579.1 von Willebrand factor type A domain-containing protein [Roseibacillus ishigakijimensis]